MGLYTSLGVNLHFSWHVVWGVGLEITILHCKILKKVKGSVSTCHFNFHVFHVVRRQAASQEQGCGLRSNPAESQTWESSQKPPKTSKGKPPIQDDVSKNDSPALGGSPKVGREKMCRRWRHLTRNRAQTTAAWESRDQLQLGVCKLENVYEKVRYFERKWLRKACSQFPMEMMLSFCPKKTKVAMEIWRNHTWTFQDVLNLLEQPLFKPSMFVLNCQQHY